MPSFGVRFYEDKVNWYLQDITSRVVAESGISTDRFHLGKIILHCLKDAPKDFILQIDAATKEKQTAFTVLERSIKTATAFKNYGLKLGDVIVMMGPNYLDMCIPMYAAFYTGVVVSTVDPAFTHSDFETHFLNCKPKLIFCPPKSVENVKTALKNIKAEAKVVEFEGDGVDKFMEEYGEEIDVEQFRAVNLDPEESNLIIFKTSGTTGPPKSCVTTHTRTTLSLPYLWSRYENFPSPIKMALQWAPVQWVSAIWAYIFSPIFRYTRLQTSNVLTIEEFCKMVNVYKPEFTAGNPNFWTMLMKPENREKCDLTCFKYIIICGSPASEVLLNNIQKHALPDCCVETALGITEVGTVVFHLNQKSKFSHLDPKSKCSVGSPHPGLQYRIVDLKSKQDILESNVKGELWLKGPTIFKGYLNDKKATDEAFSEDGWLKTGDIVYRDENFYFYVVDRINSFIKFKEHIISPSELESVIYNHSGVVDVAVTGVPHTQYGELPVVLVVRKMGSTLTSQDIQDVVYDALPEVKCEVLFVENIPMLVTTKIDRRKIKAIAMNMNRE